MLSHHFSIIVKTLQKFSLNKATDVIVVPGITTLFPKLLLWLIANSVLNQRCDQLLQLTTNVHLLHLLKETELSGVCNIGRSLKAENLSRKAQDTILQSWRHSISITLKGFNY